MPLPSGDSEAWLLQAVLRGVRAATSSPAAAVPSGAIRALLEGLGVEQGAPLQPPPPAKTRAKRAPTRAEQERNDYGPYGPGMGRFYR